MKIKAIETSVIAIPFGIGGPPQLFAGHVWNRMETLIVRVETEDGIVGWGEAFGHVAIPATKAALDTVIAPLALGQDAEDLGGLATRLLRAVHLLGRNGPFTYAVAGLEIALWDIRGKRCGQPLWHLLSGGARGPVKAYASLLNYGTDDLVAKNTTAAWNAGYRHIKLHQTTESAVLEAREAAPDAHIMLDVNCAWLPPEARAMAATLKPHSLYWLEEPVWPPEDIAGLASVRGQGIPVAAGENVAGLFGFKSLIEAGAIDIAQPSVIKLGGIGEMARIVHLCEAHGINVAPHSPYFGPGLVATLHVAVALLPDPLIEILWLQMEISSAFKTVTIHE